MVVEVEQHVAAPPADVFALLSDVERMAGLGPEHAQAGWTDRARTRFLGVNVRGQQRWEVGCTVADRIPPERFAWVTGNPAMPGARWSYDLRTNGEDTLVRQRFEHGPGCSYLREFVEAEPERAERAIARRSEELRQGMVQVLAAVAARFSPAPPEAAAPAAGRPAHGG